MSVILLNMSLVNVIRKVLFPGTFYRMVAKPAELRIEFKSQVSHLFAGGLG